MAVQNGSFINVIGRECSRMAITRLWIVAEAGRLDAGDIASWAPPGAHGIEEELEVHRIEERSCLSMLLAAIRGLRPGDRVLINVDSAAGPFAAALAALLRGSVYSLLVRRNYPEVLIASGRLRMNSFPVTAVAFFNRWLHKNSTFIIVSGEEAYREMRRKTEGLGIPIHALPNAGEIAANPSPAGVS